MQGNSINNYYFFKFKMSVTGGHCDYSTRAPSYAKWRVFALLNHSTDVCDNLQIPQFPLKNEGVGCAIQCC